jgi:hypothetical protein
VNLELQPVHDALRAATGSGIVRLFADLAEHPRTWPRRQQGNRAGAQRVL